MVTVQLHSLLRAVRDAAGKSFSGVGLLVSSDSSDLPIRPLRPAQVLPDGRPTLEVLAAISRQSSELHDGFHLVSPELKLSLISLYFSPPIVSGIEIESTRPIGGRYMAALFGSPQVLPALDTA
jgi:hypothetical protein